MTDEIIIDGVDVSGCKMQGETVEGITCGNPDRIRFANQIITRVHLCKNNPDCLYKQLKRTQNTLQDIKTLVTTDYIQIKRQLVQNYDCLDNFMQKIEDKCGEVL